MFFRDVLDQPLNELHNRNRFGNKPVVFVPVIVKGDSFTIVMIDT